MKRNVYLLAVLSLFVMWLWVPDAAAQNKRYYVKADASSSNTAAGAVSWTEACADLQSVINEAVAGDTVFVAVGTYEGGFFMKEGVQVYGGFKGDGTEMEYTDRTYPVDTADWSKCSVLDGAGSMRVLTQLTPFTRETVWDGFVIRKGSAAGAKGQIVFNAAGTAPAGIIYRWDATTHSGYMVGLKQEEHSWSLSYTDIPDLPNIFSWQADAKKDFSGSGNTALIVKTLSANAPAAYWCDTLSSGGFRDWYLPAGGELYELYNQRDSVRAAISQMKEVISSIPLLEDYYYWSGSEGDAKYAWFVHFGDSRVLYENKDTPRNVRAVRALNLFTHLDNLTFSGGGALLQENGVLRRCVVTGNKAAGMGGGVYTRGGSVEGCLVTGNRSGRGSGVYAATGSVTGLVVNSTIANNNQDTLNIAPRPAPPAIGDYYYTDGSYSTSTGAANPLSNRELAGIVCYINPSNRYAGFIMDTTQVKKVWNDAVYYWAPSLRTGGYTDWKVPSADVLRYGIYANKSVIGDALSKIGASPFNTGTSDFYWSSSEFYDTRVWYVSFGYGSQGTDYKAYNFSVRAVRAF